MSRLTSERIVNTSYPVVPPLPTDEATVLRAAVANEGDKAVIYRDGRGVLYFIDQDLDVLYVDLDGGGLPPDEVRQLPGSYVENRRISDSIIHDFTKATPINEPWESIVARSQGL